MTSLITRKNNKLQLTGDLVTGDTYPVKDFLKTYCAAKWDKEMNGWRVDVAKINEIISRSNHIGLRIDDTAPVAVAKSTGSTGWCSKCQDWCYGDCEA